MRQKIIVHVNGTAVGVEGIPDDTEVELRFYDDMALESSGADTWRQDEQGRWYVGYTFRGRMFD